MRLTKRLLLLFLALWLPVSVLAAASMSLAMAGQAQVPAAEIHEGCPQHAPAEDAGTTGAGECHGCAYCQFACTALMALSVQAPRPTAGWIAVEFQPPAASPSVPDRLQRPPLFP